MAWNDGKALTADEISTVNNWLKNDAKGDTKILEQKATEYGLNNSQRQQLGLVGQAYAGGRDLQDWEKIAAQKWATGKDASTVEQKAIEMGVTPEQVGQVFGFTGNQARAAGYGSKEGISPTMRDNMFNGREWYTPATPATPTTPASTGMVATATPTTYEAKTFDNVKQWTPTQFNNMREWAPTTATVTPWNVTDDQLVEKRLGGIIADDSKLMQMARGGALQQMNERGLANSSMAVGAAQDAVMRNALQIATPDAATFANSAQFNANANNTVGMFNADAANRAAMSNADSFNRVGMFNVDAQNVAASNNADSFNRAGMFNTEAINTASATNAGAKNAASMFNAGQTNTFNIADRELTQKGSQFDRELTQKGSQFDRQLNQQQSQFDQDLGFRLKQLGLNWDIAQMDDETRRMLGQLSASTAGVAAGISAAGQMAIAQADQAYRTSANRTQYLNNAYDNYRGNVMKIALDPNLDPDVKTRLINAEVAGFKTFATMNDVVGDFSFVDSYANTITGKNAGTPTPAETPTPSALPPYGWATDPAG